jgi:hypothetical protein
MTKYNIENVTFNGDGNHIGDKFDSPQAFTTIKDIKSAEGVELVRTVFKLATGKDKEHYLDAIEAVEKQSSPLDEKQKSNLLKLYEKLKDQGMNLAIKNFYEFLSKHKPDLIHYFASISESFSQLPK